MRLLRPAALALVALVALPPAAAAFPRDLPYADIVLGAARRYRVDPALVHAVIAVESAYRRYAVSPAGAQGLMQLMPSTQADYGVSDPFNVRQNVYAGVAHSAPSSGSRPTTPVPASSAAPAACPHGLRRVSTCATSW